MSSENCAEGMESLVGAMERAEQMPDCMSDSNGNGLWDEGNVWFGDWGKWEDYSK